MSSFNGRGDVICRCLTHFCFFFKCHAENEAEIHEVLHEDSQEEQSEQIQEEAVETSN